MKKKHFWKSKNRDPEKETLDNLVISCEEIKAEMKALDKNKAMSHNGISCWVLKECVKELSKALNILMQDSLNQGKLPERW